MHAHYACRHSGACCTAGWTIPVEASRQGIIGTPFLIPDASGACAFYDRDRASHRCRVHREHGEHMLPEACQQFPRRALIDDRGTFVTLSHFCPTAAGLLFGDGPLTIVAGPPAFPPMRAYDGLDARGHWPPLVREGALFDLDTYSRWEQFIVEACDRGPTPAATLLRVAAAAEHLRAWHVSSGPFAVWAEEALERARIDDAAPAALDRYRGFMEVPAYARVIETVPAGLRAPVLPEDVEAAFERWVAPTWSGERAVRRYLAAKAFGSWAGYESRGVRTSVAELAVCEMVLRVEAARACASAGQALDRERLHAAIRAADWLLIHLADRETLTAWLGTVERI